MLGPVAPGRFGPNTAEVERAIALGRMAAGLPPVMWFFSRHYMADWEDAEPARDLARAAAEAAGLVGEYQAAYDAGYEAGYESTHCAAEDATFAGGFAAQALAVRHLLDAADFERQYHLWGEVFGPPSPATPDREPPRWPPAIALGESCGKGPCLHGAARPRVTGFRASARRAAGTTIHAARRLAANRRYPRQP